MNDGLTAQLSQLSVSIMPIYVRLTIPQTKIQNDRRQYVRNRFQWQTKSITDDTFGTDLNYSLKDPLAEAGETLNQN